MKRAQRVGRATRERCRTGSAGETLEATFGEVTAARRHRQGTRRSHQGQRGPSRTIPQNLTLVPLHGVTGRTEILHC